MTTKPPQRPPPSPLRSYFNYLRALLLFICVIGIVSSLYFGVPATIWFLLFPVVVVLELGVALWDGLTRKRVPRPKR